MTHIYSGTVPVCELSDEQKTRCLELLAMYFLGVTAEDFYRDLSEKEYVLVLATDEDLEQIVGFSTIVTFPLQIPGRHVRVVFSGDTIVMPEYRTSTRLGYEIARYFQLKMQQFPQDELYYVLMSKGWRTYRLLQFFFHSYAPHPHAPVCQLAKEVMDAFGKKKYPDEYDVCTGLIRFHKETQRLVPHGVDALPAGNDPAIDFFLEVNPHYLCGNELVCVAQLEASNFTRGHLRLLR